MLKRAQEKMYSSKKMSGNLVLCWSVFSSTFVPASVSNSYNFLLFILLSDWHMFLVNILLYQKEQKHRKNVALFFGGIIFQVKMTLLIYFKRRLKSSPSKPRARDNSLQKQDRHSVFTIGSSLDCHFPFFSSTVV